MIGYTEQQAERLKHRAEMAVAKAEDAAAELRRVVPDFDAGRYTQQLDLDHCLEEFRNVARGVSETVERRRR